VVRLFAELIPIMQNDTLGNKADFGGLYGLEEVSISPGKWTSHTAGIHKPRCSLQQMKEGLGYRQHAATETRVALEKTILAVEDSWLRDD
jgi:hypothetical protein